MMVYNIVSIFDYNYTSAFVSGLYFFDTIGPIFLWAFTRTDLRGANLTGLGRHTLVSSPQDSI
jgi:hypothetical protein